MASEEWSSATLGGLAVGGQKRPLLPIVCDTKYDQPTTLAAFDHLTNRLGLKAILALDSVAATDVIGKAVERKTFIYCDRCTVRSLRRRRQGWFGRAIQSSKRRTPLSAGGSPRPKRSFARARSTTETPSASSL